MRVNGEVVADTDDALTLQEATYPAVQYIPLATSWPPGCKAQRHGDVLPVQGRRQLLPRRHGGRRDRRRRRSGPTSSPTRPWPHRRSRRVLSRQGGHRRRSGAPSLSAVHSSASVVFDGPASPGLTLSPLRRGRGDPCYHVARDGAIWRTSLMAQRTGHGPDHEVGARHRRLRGMGKRRNGIRRNAARPARGRRRSRPASRPPNRRSPRHHRRVPHLRLGRTDRVLEALIPAVLEQRVSGMDALPGVAAVGHQVRHARARTCAAAHAGAAVCRGVATHPVVGVPSRQRRSRAAPARSSAARSAPTRWSGWPRGTARAGARGADVAAGGRGVDGGRDRAARLRRCRRAVGRRLPPRQRWSAGRCSATASTTRRWSSCSSRCARIGTARCGCSRSAGWRAIPAFGSVDRRFRILRAI